MLDPRRQVTRFGELLPISEMGQKLKSWMRAYVFRFAPETGHRSMRSARPESANNGQMATPWLCEILLIELLQHFDECSQSRPQMAMARVIQKQTGDRRAPVVQNMACKSATGQFEPPDDAGPKDRPTPRSRHPRSFRKAPLAL